MLSLIRHAAAAAAAIAAAAFLLIAFHAAMLSPLISPLCHVAAMPRLIIQVAFSAADVDFLRRHDD